MEDFSNAYPSHDPEWVKDMHAGSLSAKLV